MPSALHARGAISSGAVALALLFAIGLLLAPGEAGAASRVEVQNRRLQMTLVARTDNDYLVGIQTRGHRQVSVTLLQNSVAARYRTVGHVTRNGIEADFGNLGRISVRFQGRRRPFEQFPDLFDPPPGLFGERHCRGRKPVREVGSFRGTIRFRGEGGYTRLSTHRARGEVTRTFRRVCRDHSRPEPDFGDDDDGIFGDAFANLLVAVDRSDGRRIEFAAINFDFGPDGDFLESLFGTLAVTLTRERDEGIEILRQDTVLGDEGSLLIDRRNPARPTATVALPKPIPGTAKYTKEGAAPATWIGSLTARLPGLGPVPLVGPGFRAALCKVPLDELFESNSLSGDCLNRPGAQAAGFAARARAIGLFERPR